MAIALNKKCKDRLLELLPDAIKMIKVRNGHYLTDVSSILPFILPEQALPQTGKFRKLLESSIGHFPLVTYCADRISIDLEERFEYQTGDDEIDLTTFEGYEDPKLVADWLLEGFENLPNAYSVTFELPADVSKPLLLLDRGLKISDEVTICPANERFQNVYPRNSENTGKQKRVNQSANALSLLSMFNSEEQTWNEDSCYLSVEVEGYINRYGSTQPAVQATNIVKSFFGLCLALGLLKTEFKLHRMGQSAVSAFVHLVEDGERKLDGRFPANEQLNRTLRELTLIDLKKEYDNEKFKQGLVLNRLSLIQHVFRDRIANERLMLAAQWFFDGHARQDEMLSFVQTVIVLEVLLGDKADSDEMGLGALLKNRAAYLIAKSPKEREDLLSKIGKIYQLRSKVVHSGKHFFTPDERSLSGELNSICNRIFMREIELLKKQHEADEKSKSD